MRRGNRAATYVALPRLSGLRQIECKLPRQMVCQATTPGERIHTPRQFDLRFEISPLGWGTEPDTLSSFPRCGAMTTRRTFVAGRVGLLRQVANPRAQHGAPFAEQV